MGKVRPRRQLSGCGERTPRRPGPGRAGGAAHPLRPWCGAGRRRLVRPPSPGEVKTRPGQRQNLDCYYDIALKLNFTLKDFG